MDNQTLKSEPNDPAVVKYHCPTPGPWGVSDDVDCVIYDPVTGSGIACTWTNGDEPYIQNNAERLANARLIAAAPDMLAALLAILDHLHMALSDNDESNQTSAQLDAYDEARIAISKATGAAS